MITAIVILWVTLREAVIRFPHALCLILYRSMVHLNILVRDLAKTRCAVNGKRHVGTNLP